MIQLFDPIALEYINALHAVFFIAFGYIAYSFFRDWYCGVNGLTLALGLFMASLTAGEAWSLIALIYFGPGENARFWRAVQLTMVLAALVYLIIQHAKLVKIEPKPKDNAEHKDTSTEP